ncbi:MAG: carbonic anhydrase [Pseudomonadota bacterium]
MSMSRLSLTALALVAGLGFVSSARAEEHGAHWSYEGLSGPTYWGSLSHDYEACAGGHQQSPIDLRAAVPAQLAPIGITYQSQPLTVVNNGHTLQANLAPGNFILFDGERYNLLQYHFHTPSEHTVGGQPAPMEVHLVHKNQNTGALVVLGVMLVPGEANPVLEAVLNSAPAEAGPPREVADVKVDPSRLLPAGRDYFRYEGSLTTPPCSEVVHWVVFKQPVTVSAAQIDRFAKLFPHNARPVQPSNRRFLLESGKK